MNLIAGRNIWMRCWLGCIALLAGLWPAAAPASPSTNLVPAVIQKNYDDAKRSHLADAADPTAAWRFSRACFDRAEFSRTSAERAHLAEEGMAAARRVMSDRPARAEGHYYYALNVAQLARTKLWGALPLLSQMERGWLDAGAIDEKLDYAGPDRYVGLLYRDAPGWPLSLGDKTKARSHLLRAVELAPNFPENYLNLIETHLQWHERAPADAALAKLRALLPAAHAEFNGAYWDESWKDWNARLKKIDDTTAAHSEK